MKITEQLKGVMADQDRMRNIAIVAHIDHGKTTFSDNLLAISGLLSRDLAGKALALDFRDDERERGITIDAAIVSLFYEHLDPKTEEKKGFMINIVDTPGHVDFGGDVSRSLRAVDGCIVVVCAVEGIMPQTETVLRQALKEHVKPMLFINKIDRLIRELQFSAEQIQERLTKIIVDFNKLVRFYSGKDNFQVSAGDDSVCFGSAFHNWAISSSSTKRKNITMSRIIDLYHEPEEDGALRHLARESPLAEIVLDSVIRHIPPPPIAQKMRIPFIWHGDPGSGLGKALLSADPEGKASFVITKITTDIHAGDLCAGRIFSGTLRPGTVLINCRTKRECAISSIFLVYGPKKEFITQAIAGSIIALSGMDGAITGDTLAEDEAHPFEELKTLFEPVITKTIEPKRPQEIDKLMQILERLHQEDPSMQCLRNTETGEILISGMGELHLEVLERWILSEYKLEVSTGVPLVIYRETVSSMSEAQESRQDEDHDGQAQEQQGARFLFVAEPLEDIFTYGDKDGDKDSDAAKKGRYEDDDNENDNLLEFSVSFDGIKHGDSLKDVVASCFSQVMSAGVLGKEPCTGIKMVLKDVLLENGLKDSRDFSNLSSNIRNAMRSALKCAKPLLLEPVQILRFDLPEQYIGEVSKLVAAKRGDIIDMHHHEGRVIIEAKLAVAEMIGIASDIRSATEGKVSFSIAKQLFEPVPPEMQEQVLLAIKRRKGFFVSGT